MKQGDRVIHKKTGEKGTIEVLLAPGSKNMSAVRFDGQMDAYYIPRSQLQLVEEDKK